MLQTILFIFLSLIGFLIPSSILFAGEPEDQSRKLEGMVLIKGGCYDMGDTFGDGVADERPVHNVCVDDFYIGQYEVTVGEFRRFVDETGYKTEAERGGMAALAERVVRLPWINREGI